MSRQPEARTSRDGAPVDASYARADRVRDQKHILDADELPENPIDAAVVEVFGRDADEPDEERTRLDAEHAAQLEELRERLRRPITAKYFDDIARGGPSVVEWFFTDDEAEPT